MRRSQVIVAVAASGLFTFTTSAIAQTTWTVCADGCQFTSINAAIDASSNGDVIQLAAETYSEGSVINTDGKAITVRGATDKAGNALSILDGAREHRVLICNSSETSTTIFVDLVIQYGSGDYGGEIHNINSSPTLTRCAFTGNSAAFGGGMYNDASNPTLTDCTFRNNSAEYNGGGMGNKQSSPALTGCKLVTNISKAHGGGMHNESSSPTLSNCAFMGNSNGTKGGGMFNDAASSPTLIDCAFTGNSARVISGGGIYNEATSSPTLANCEFKFNMAGINGGGMFNEAGSPILTNCSFCGNTDGSGFNSISGSIDGSSSGNNLLDVGCVFGDINLDGVVNLADRTDLSAIIGICDADINGDGMVDGGDLSYVLGWWGICGTP